MTISATEEGEYKDILKYLLRKYLIVKVVVGTTMGGAQKVKVEILFDGDQIDCDSDSW